MTIYLSQACTRNKDGIYFLYGYVMGSKCDGHFVVFLNGRLFSDAESTSLDLSRESLLKVFSGAKTNKANFAVDLSEVTKKPQQKKAFSVSQSRRPAARRRGICHKEKAQLKALNIIRYNGNETQAARTRAKHAARRLEIAIATKKKPATPNLNTSAR
jgi:hypothetical protein